MEAEEENLTEEKRLSLGQEVSKGRGKKNRLFLGKSPKLWVGGGQES